MNHRPHPTRPAPRAGVDRIDDPATALAIIQLAQHDPPRDETVVLLLDADRRGRCITVVSGTWFPDDVIDVVECVVEVGAAAIVVASCRPCGGLVEGDLDRWLDMSDIASEHGIELVEWFVIGDGVHCPRDEFGERPRW